MFKRFMLTLTFVALFGAAGLSLTDNAEARGRSWGRPYVSSYYGPRAYYYSSYAPYRTYYRSYYTPRPYYYDPYAYDYYYYRPAPRIAVRVGPWW
jgi:hypothetical protein